MRGRSAWVAVFVVSLLTFATPAFADDRAELDQLIARYAEIHGIPESLLHRVIKRESNYNPKARTRRYIGLMQISHATARSMGYKGSASGLLDAETNLKYAGKYLAGAYRVAGGNESKAVRYYAAGYYYTAKRKGMLAEVGLAAGKKVRRKPGQPLVIVPSSQTAEAPKRKKKLKPIDPLALIPVIGDLY